MDDEIDIEEHDILEHPQVKAVFPDLTKIQIQAHTTGVSFLDETESFNEGLENLLIGEKDYTINNSDDDVQYIEDTITENDNLSNSVQEYAVNKDNFEEFTGDGVFENEGAENTSIIVGDQSDNTPIITEEDNINKTAQNEVVDLIQEISDDECIEKAQISSANAFVNETSITEFTKAISRITKLSDGNQKVVSARVLIENVLEISDDEESELPGEVENGDELNEKAENGDDVELIKDVPENNEIIEESPENNEVTESPYFKDYKTNKIPQQNGLIKVEKDTSLDTEKMYPHVPIKEEIDFVPVKEELDDDYENYNLEHLPDTSNNEELPPEDIYHFKNKIILGSKPSPQVDNLVDIIRETRYLVVLLDDWGVHLNQSKTYCNDCQILFTTPNAIDAHKMTAHSLLAPLPNRAVKSTAKSSISVPQKRIEIKNIARKSTGSIKNANISDSTFCNHCNVNFKDHTALIKHLYVLLPAKPFTCTLCNEKFQNQSDLVSHSSVHVKIEHRKILKAKTGDKNPILRNLLCNAAKPLEAKVVPKSIPVKISRDWDKYTSKYKCMVCSDIIDGYNSARRHRLTHTESMSNGKRAFILKRLVSKKVNVNNSKDKLKFEEDNKSGIKRIKLAAKNDVKKTSKVIHTLKTIVDEDKPLELIPKSALFQCTKCSLHFTSSVSGTSHVTRNMCGANQWTCPTCKKKFRKIDESCHRKQHELGAKIKIYKISKNTNERTLCKCLKCGVYFSYTVLKMHINKCGKIPTAKCLKCNILLAKERLLAHSLKHENMKLKPKDFILVDYAVINDKTKPGAIKKIRNKPVKVKEEPGIDITVKKEPGVMLDNSKIVNKMSFEKEKLKLYYCTHCKCCTAKRDFNTKRTHLARRCATKYKYYCFNCQLCGLLIPNISRNAHEILHTQKNLTIKDFEFYEFTSLKRITPSIPIYPHCVKCKIHFLDRNMKKKHICGEDYDNCTYCGEKYELSALKVHKPFHKLQTQKVKLSQEQPKIMPELMMKYESMNTIWNILFICEKCELVSDVYNKAVEHSQAHLKYEATQHNTIKCYICNLKFDETCWSKHSELHSRMTINKNDFKMLKYSPKHLLDESWFQMFESLPEKEIRQIIDISVFGSERSLKMKLVKDGLPEFTVYCCSLCQVSFDNNNILNHVKSQCKLSTNVCEKCDIAFHDANSLGFHKELHNKGIKKEEFRIVHFVKTPGVSVKDTKVKGKTKAKVKEPDVNLKKPESKRKKKGSHFVLYKCEKCSVCLHHSGNQDYHVCAKKYPNVFCSICKQTFSCRQKFGHDAKHMKYPEFTEKNIKIVTFLSKNKSRYKIKPKNKSKQIVIKPANKAKSKSEHITSECKLNNPRKMSSNTEIGLLRTKGSSTKINKRKSTTNTEHPKFKQRKTINSSRHNRSLENVNESDIEDKKTAQVYKCDCGLHYTSLKTIEKHIETCNNSNEIFSENCSKCGLLFPTDVLVSHLCKHHSQDTKITVENIHKEEATSTQGKSKDKEYVKIYKCSDCNVYYLNQNTCYKHTYSKHEMLDPKQYIECKICKLQFTLQTLRVHMKRHHETEFDLDKVLVEEYHPSVGKGAPKIDIYFASERVQNVQVSSSNDKDDGTE